MFLCGLRRRFIAGWLLKYQICYIITGDNQIAEASGRGLLRKRNEHRDLLGSVHSAEE
jgi:hypothetical protein